MLVKAIVCLDKLIIGLGAATVTGIIGVIAQRFAVDPVDEAVSSCIDKVKGKKEERGRK
jgi:hypothetical protein